MDGIIIAVVSVIVIVGSLYLAIKASRNQTGTEISKLHEDIHINIDKIDSMTEEIKRVNRGFDIKGKRLGKV